MKIKVLYGSMEKKRGRIDENPGRTVGIFG
jgi:hypothetical protein